LEALASGVPVVQPNASSFPEIITTSGGGVLVPPGDPIALATAWHELIQNPAALQTFRENGRHAAEHSYSVKVMRERFLAHAKKLVNFESK
jgi:glycosyltransferase involved in cell wall biosynthesis